MTPDGNCYFSVGSFQGNVTPDDIANMQVVEVFVDVGTYRDGMGQESLKFEYIVSNAYEYLTNAPVAKTVSAGCIIGETFPASEFGDAYVIVSGSVGGEQFYPEQYLTEYSTNTEPCVNTPEYNGCLNANSGIYTDNYWNTSSGNVAFANGGFSIIRGEYINQFISGLTPGEVYSVAVTASTNGSLLVSLEDSSQLITFDQTIGEYGTQYAYVGLTSPTSTADLRIEAVDSGMFIASVCLSRDTSQQAPSSACYFANPSFSSGLTGWYYNESTGATAAEAVLGDGGYILQNVVLNPNDDGSPHAYTLSVDFNGWVDDAPTGTTSLDWTFGALSGSFTPEEFSYIDQIEGRNALTATLDVALQIDEQFRFDAVVKDSGGGASPAFMLIDRICISPDPTASTGGNFPGQNLIIDTGEDATPTCESVRTPRNVLNVVEWIGWLWEKLLNFWRCVIVPLLQSMLDWLAGIGSGIQAFGVYIGELAQVAMQSATNALLYIAGLFVQLINHPALQMLMGNITAFFTLAFGFIIKMFQFLYNLITTVFSLIAEMVTNFNTVQNAWNNAPPKTIPALPNCDGSDLSHPVCGGVWVLNNSFLKPDSYGELAVVFLSIVAFIRAILWIIKDFNNTARSVTTSV